MTLFDLIEKEDLSKEAIIEGEKRLTYLALRQAAWNLAGFFKRKFKIVSGDKVALLLLNQHEFFVSLFALRLIGAVAVPINIGMAPDDIRYVLSHADIKVLIAETEILQKMRKAAPEASPKPAYQVMTVNCSGMTRLQLLPSFEKAIVHKPLAQEARVAVKPDDLAILLYTSGTTGNPKGVMLSEANLLSNLEGFSGLLGIQGDYKMLLGLPLFHAYGLICGLYALHSSWPIVLEPRFQPKQMLKSLIDEQVNILPLVPTMYTILLQRAKRMSPEDFQHLKYCISGGAALAPALLQEVEELLGAKVLEGYGLTETSPVLAVNTPVHGICAGTVGSILPNVDLRLVCEHGLPVEIETGKESKEGEIEVKGPNVMSGYYKDTEATEETFNQGWFKTGDLGHIDPDGRLVISGGRKKDLIIRAGENIAPVKIEHCLAEHPDVKEVAVIGKLDPRLGEAILACVELREAAADKEALVNDLKAWSREKLPPQLQPDAYAFYEELPKNPTGKIMKKVLRQEVNPDIPSSC